MIVKELRNQLEQKKGQANQIRKDIETCSYQISLKKRSIMRHEKAREIIKEVALQTQLKLSGALSEIVTLALESVFPDPYQFEVDFVQRRNKTECDLLLRRGTELIPPLQATGGGVVDVVSFALRAVCWFFSLNRTRRVLVLDEPFKHLSDSYMGAAGEMLQLMAKRLNLQIIAVSHEVELMECADKVFKVEQKNGMSIVKVN